MKKRDLITEVNESCGIDYTFLAKKLGMSKNAFDYARERGLTDEEADMLEYNLRAIGMMLMSMRIPESMRKSGHMKPPVTASTASKKRN